ncbi:hypothetical protein, partial [Achromobacter xylosoxidans]|uniref:hypothetical protein n=1 Tax=Alcaligenes xylosoxydans xylosoxydans TaxID=85698 RepID=UPI001A93FDCB
LFVLRHVKTPEGWINIQLSGVSSHAGGFFFLGQALASDVGPGGRRGSARGVAEAGGPPAAK